MAVSHQEIPIAELNQLVDSQSVMLATNHIFQIAAVVFILAATVIWIAPKSSQPANPAAAH